MDIKVFKFGGASIRDAAGVRNLARILKKFSGNRIVVVVSAMGKTTNAMEELLKAYMARDPLQVVAAFEKTERYHREIISGLFEDPGHPVGEVLRGLFDQLRGYIRKGHLYTGIRKGYNFEYDQIVSYGELLSSAIVYHYLADQDLPVSLADVRNLVRTDATYRDARIDWKATKQKISEQVPALLPPTDEQGSALLVTQGFIGSDPLGNTTTLGREGSDFTAAIFAYSLNINEMTIWKDVPGVMNADPKWRPDAIRLKALSYREAIELAYYGASVIHPKTIKPLENNNIILKVKSFFDPDGEGTTIQQLDSWSLEVPVYIRKQHQVLLSLSSRDFSFIMEENLSHIFSILASNGIKVNVMQNSAISFSFCFDYDPHKIPVLLDQFQEEYQIRYNDNVELITVRHYDQHGLRDLIGSRQVLLEQKSRSTLQLVLG